MGRARRVTPAVAAVACTLAMGAGCGAQDTGTDPGSTTAPGGAEHAPLATLEGVTQPEFPLADGCPPFTFMPGEDTLASLPEEERGVFEGMVHTARSECHERGYSELAIAEFGTRAQATALLRELARDTGYARPDHLAEVSAEFPPPPDMICAPRALPAGSEGCAASVGRFYLFAEVTASEAQEQHAAERGVGFLAAWLDAARAGG